MLRVAPMFPPEQSATLLTDAVPEIRIDPADARHVVGLTAQPEFPALVYFDNGEPWAGGTARDAAWPMAWGPVAGLSPARLAEIGRRAGAAPLAEDLAAAADPRDPANLYLAWVERWGDTDSRLCLRRSRDGGSTWSPDLRIVARARGAALAVNDRGEVVLVYRQLTGRLPDQRWVVYLEHSSNGFITMAQWVLADMPATPPVLGESAAAVTSQRVIAVAEAFYGAFLADGGVAWPYAPCGLVAADYAGLDAVRLRDPVGSGAGPSARDPFFFRFCAAV